MGIFAGGLSSFASNNGEEESANEEDNEDATAGMELSLMGVQQRPIVFFVGKGDLMGLVWSGAGSERTTALLVSNIISIKSHNCFVVKQLLKFYMTFFAGKHIAPGSQTSDSII